VLASVMLRPHHRALASDVGPFFRVWPADLLLWKRKKRGVSAGRFVSLRLVNQKFNPPLIASSPSSAILRLPAAGTSARWARTPRGTLAVFTLPRAAPDSSR